VLVNIVRQSTTRVDFIEDKLLADRVSTSRRDLGSLRRTLVRLQRLLAPEPAALFRLLSRPPAWIDGEDLQDLRQAAEEFSAAVVDLGALVERVKLLQEELAAQINEQTNRTLFILTVVTVLALPINLIAGLFGMNVGGIPLAEHRHGFQMVVLPLLALTLFLGYMALGRHRD
jgi:zinc transporter